MIANARFQPQTLQVGLDVIVDGGCLDGDDGGVMLKLLVRWVCGMTTKVLSHP